MSAVDDILGAMPADQISQQVGASPDEVRTAAAAVLPALLGGLQANAGDPSGAGSILQALGQHDDDLLTGGADLSAIDEQDGTAIASHIFGDQEDEVVNRLGGLPAVGRLGRRRRPRAGSCCRSSPRWCSPGWPTACSRVGAAGSAEAPRARRPTPRPRSRAAVVAALPARSTTCCATCSAARPVGRRRPVGLVGRWRVSGRLRPRQHHRGRARRHPRWRASLTGFPTVSGRQEAARCRRAQDATADPRRRAAHHAVSAGMPR